MASEIQLRWILSFYTYFRELLSLFRSWGKGGAFRRLNRSWCSAGNVRGGRHGPIGLENAVRDYHTIPSITVIIINQYDWVSETLLQPSTSPPLHSLPPLFLSLRSSHFFLSGTLIFYFASNPLWDMCVSVFTGHTWTGHPIETEGPPPSL